MNHWLELWNKPKIQLSHADELYLSLPLILLLIGCAVALGLMMWWGGRRR